MKRELKINAILLAAGKSSRFGKNKLITPLIEKSVIEYTLEKLKHLELHQTILVTSKEIREHLQEQKGILFVQNDKPEEGISYSIKLGIQKGDTCDAYLFLVGDQPLLRDDTLKQLLEAYKALPDMIIGLGDKQILGNPVIFPSTYKEKLMHIEGDRGGKYLIYQENLPYRIQQVTTEEELWDVDTPEDYEKMIRRMKNGVIKK